MSIRINLSMFSLTKLQSLFGSGNEAAAKLFCEKLWYLEDSGDLQPKDNRAAQQALKKALFEGTPITRVVTEGYGHVELAKLMAEYQQHPRVLDCDFKYFAVESFWQEFRGIAQEPGRSLFDVFLKGRPLFGKKISPKLEVRYGYLTKKEVNSVTTSLQLLTQKLPDNQDVSEIAGGYLECLRRVCSGKRDLWVEVG